MYSALGRIDETELAKANSKYKLRVKEIVDLHNQYEKKVESLKVKMDDQGLIFSAYDDNYKLEKQRPDRQTANDMINKIIVKLQYSKEPDFLIDCLILDLILKKESVLTN